MPGCDEPTQDTEAGKRPSSRPGQGQVQRATLPESLPALLPNLDTTPAHTHPPALTRCCLHDLGGATQQGRGDSLHRWHDHFLMFYKKGKADFYLRVLVWSSRDHVPWERLCSDGPSPWQVEAEPEVGWREVFTCPLPATDLSWAPKMTMPMSVAGLILFEEQAQSVSLAGEGGVGWP